MDHDVLSMQIPKTPTGPSTPATTKPPSPSQDVAMTGTDALPAPPFDSHPPELLPAAIKTAFPSGNPATGTRTSEQEEALQAKKTEILKTMTVQEAQDRYKQIAAEMVERLGAAEKKSDDWKAEKEKLVKDQALEEKVLRKMLSAPQED